MLFRRVSIFFILQLLCVFLAKAGYFVSTVPADEMPFSNISASPEYIYGELANYSDFQVTKPVRFANEGLIHGFRLYSLYNIDYRILYKQHNADWNWDTAWLKSNVRALVGLSKPGFYFFGLQIRDADTKEVLVNIYLGQSEVVLGNTAPLVGPFVLNNGVYFSKSVEFSNIGNTNRFFFSSSNANHRYRILVKYQDDVDWRYNNPWLIKEAITDIRPDKPGIWFFNLQVLDSSKNLITHNIYVGQMLVEDPSLLPGANYFDDVIFQYNINTILADQSELGSITSFSDLLKYAKSQFVNVKSEYTNLGKLSDYALFPVFLTNFVSEMWPYGNKKNFRSTGCILDNEVTGKLDSFSTFPNDLFNAPLACCTDYALTLFRLLWESGYDVRLVGLGTHVLVEINLGMKRLSLDPTYNIVYSSSWAAAQKSKSQVQIFQFNLADASPASQGFRKRHLAERYYIVHSFLDRKYQSFFYLDSYQKISDYYGTGIADLYLQSQ